MRVQNHSVTPDVWNELEYCLDLCSGTDVQTWRDFQTKLHHDFMDTHTK